MQEIKTCFDRRKPPSLLRTSRLEKVRQSRAEGRQYYFDFLHLNDSRIAFLAKPATAWLMIVRAWVILMVFTATVSSRAELLLKGIMIADDRPLFSIYSTEDQTSKWIRLGQTFAEFKATKFDAVSDTLTMENGEASRRLKLQSSTIKVTTEDRKALLTAQQKAVAEELLALSRKLVSLQNAKMELAHVQRSDPNIAEELAAVSKRRQELVATARDIDRTLTELTRAFVQKLTPPPPPQK